MKKILVFLFVLIISSCSKDEIQEPEPVCNCVKTVYQSRHGITYSRYTLSVEKVPCQDEADVVTFKEVKGIDLWTTWYIVECN